MLTAIIPKLPMRNKPVTRQFYCEHLGFKDLGTTDYEGYLIVGKGDLEIHFFEHKTLNVSENYGQIYIRVSNIEKFYQTLLDNKTRIHPNGKLETKPWQQKEFSVLDCDHNLLTFGESL